LSYVLVRDPEGISTTINMVARVMCWQRMSNLMPRVASPQKKIKWRMFQCLIICSNRRKITKVNSQKRK
jgi:hypothetical protein